ncbi:Proline-tRNA ligase class IIa [Carpediemonas membranifera]|uniref:proline--tRNA ligase n=1 Tax=Carpediemonas membranifera TaxID=201153 RepID=A0A8J6E4F1_9EUKA|nr:Proline-tRNA ligase class IIa [Carpediemonas membranifera]|eukprot:KAG9397118.1 Proline-tRNA ligase class IIa [Carpediemonas membranifera]
MSDLVEFNKDKSDFAKWYDTILIAADILDKRYPVKGMPVMKPAGWYIHEKIMRLAEDEWEKQGIDKCQFPTLIPETFLTKEEEHVAGFEKECFWVTKGGLNTLDIRLALRPTSETAMYSMFSLWVRSYADLPLKVHQSCNVFRYETKSTKPLIRVREIPWNEAHTAHATAEDAEENLRQAWVGYDEVINRQLGFYGLVLRRPEWDKFAGSIYTEVLDTIMPCGRVLQTVGAHNLGQKFAKVFDIKYQTEDNREEYAHMTCYGISTRVMAACLSIHGDDRGLVLPPVIAKVQAVVIPIKPKQPAEKTEENIAAAEASWQKILASSKKITAALQAAGIRAKLDDSDRTPGFKYAHWELRGIPLRVEVGPRDVDHEDEAEFECMMVPRNNNMPAGKGKKGKQAKQAAETPQTGLDKRLVKQADIAAEAHKFLDDIIDKLRDEAQRQHNERVVKCFRLSDVKKAMKKGKVALVPFCDMGDKGKQAEDRIREYLGADLPGEVRGWDPRITDSLEGKTCIASKPDEPDAAHYWAYIARAY